MKKISEENINKYLNYLIIAYAFSFPISKAAINIIEFLTIILWIYQGNWNYKLDLIKSSKFLLFLGLFLLWSCISILWASDLAFATHYIGKYHHLLMIPIIYTALDLKYIKYIFSAFIASVFISEVLSYGIYFDLLTFKHASKQFPTPFMHHITYSVMIVFTSTILLVNSLQETRLKYKLFEITFFATMIINLFINGGRTGQVIFIILMFIVLMMYLKQKIKATFLALILVSATFLIAYNFSGNFESRIHQFQSGISKMIHEDDYTGQGGMRAAMWIVGTDVFIDNLFLGTGIGNEMKDANYYASLHNFKTRDMKIFADYHNVFVNVAAQLGIVGLILIILTFYSFLKLTFKTKKYQILNTTFMISFILFSLTHNTIHLMFPLVFFALFTGIFSAISRIENQ